MRRVHREDTVSWQSPPPPQPSRRTTRQQWIDKALKEFISYQPQVSGRLTDYDAKQFNLQVTSAYAKMYLTNSSIFKWAGMAALPRARLVGECKGHGS